MMRDIGKTINGEVLSSDGYLIVENLYINAVLEFVKCNNADEFVIIDIGRFNFRKQKIKPGKNMRKLFKRAIDNDIVSIADLPDIIRLNLRELMTCQLKYKDIMFVHFGWDYYVYIGSMNKCEAGIKRIEESGLFVEKFESPYLKINEDPQSF